MGNSEGEKPANTEKAASPPRVSYGVLVESNFVCDVYTMVVLYIYHCGMNFFPYFPYVV